jgi:putative transposase
LWEDAFHPQAAVSRAVFEQKLAYLHENPVRKRLVRRPEELVHRPEDWWYSSASGYAGEKDVCSPMDALEL